MTDTQQIPPPPHEQVAVVTGGASGIGFHSAQRLAAVGMTVVVADIDPDKAQTAATELTSHGTVTPLALDVADPSSVEAALGSVLAEHGRVDVLVNSAGVTTTSRPLWETPVSVYEDLWRIHLLGTFLTCKQVVPGMIDRGYGRIVNVASVAGKEGNAGSSAYSSAKGAVIAMTKSLGKETAGTGVVTNVVTPGIIDTPLLATATPEHVERLLAKIPMGRAGRPEEVAAMIAWMASSECSFTTGSVFDASGGRTTY